MQGALPFEVMTLTDLEFSVAERIGRERAAYAASRRLNSRHTEVGKTTGSAENHMMGVAAELAVARILRLPWQSNVGTIHGTDVGLDVEVRCRRLRTPEVALHENPIRAGLLTLGSRDKTKLDKAFVLVHRYDTHASHELCALGWALGSEVLRRKYWQEDPDMADGVCRLPHEELKTISQLIEWLDDRHERRHDERLRKYLAGTGEPFAAE